MTVKNNRLHLAPILTLFIFANTLAYGTEEKTKTHSTLSTIATTAFLITAGTWLALKQIPRISGYENTSLCTKLIAGLFFTIGLSGTTLGISRLIRWTKDRNLSENTKLLSSLFN